MSFCIVNILFTGIKKFSYHKDIIFVLIMVINFVNLGINKILLEAFIINFQ